MSSKTWRDIAKPIIAATIKENQGKELKVVKAALREAYPWGQRKMHPYKIWCDEVKRQLGLKKVKIKGEVNDPFQTKLFI
jgi:hypothetical protein